MKVYISGPISGMPDSNKDAFASASNFLTNRGFEVVNPIEVCKDGGNQNWNWYMRKGFEAMLDCDAIVLLDGWTRSRGSMAELNVATTCGMKVFRLRTMAGHQLWEVT